MKKWCLLRRKAPQIYHSVTKCKENCFTLKHFKCSASIKILLCSGVFAALRLHMYINASTRRGSVSVCVCVCVCVCLCLCMCVLY